MKYFLIVCLFGLLSSLAKPKPTDSKFDLQVTVRTAISISKWCIKDCFEFGLKFPQFDRGAVFRRSR